jgi:hypothetical protein
MQFKILNSTVIPGQRIDSRNWLQKLRDWLWFRQYTFLYREKYAYFFVDAPEGLLINGCLILIAACHARGADATWMVTKIDDDGFHAKLTSPIMLCDLEKFNKLKDADALVYAQAWRENSN